MHGGCGAENQRISRGSRQRERKGCSRQREWHALSACVTYGGPLAPYGCGTRGLLFQCWPVPSVISRLPSLPVPVAAALGKHCGIDSPGVVGRSLLLDAVLSGVASGICFCLGRECGNRNIRRCGQSRVSFACILSFNMYTGDTVGIKTQPLLPELKV